MVSFRLMVLHRDLDSSGIIVKLLNTIVSYC